MQLLHVHSYSRVATAVVFQVKAIPFGRKNMQNVSEQAGEQMENCSNFFPIGGSSIVLMSACASSKFKPWWCERKWQSLKWKSRWFHPNDPAPFVQNKLTRATKTSDVKFGSFRTSAQKTSKCVQTSTVLTRRHLALIHIYQERYKV